MSVTQTIKCAKCNEPLSPELLNPGAAQTPCPKCGSTERFVQIEAFDEVTVTSRDSVEGEVRDPARRSKDKVRRRFFYGSQKRESQGDYIYKERDIDRDNDRYREFIREETGKVIVDQDEPLRDHRGHGSDKFKTKKTSEGND